MGRSLFTCAWPGCQTKAAKKHNVQRHVYLRHLRSKLPSAHLHIADHMVKPMIDQWLVPCGADEREAAAAGIPLSNTSGPSMDPNNTVRAGPMPMPSPALPLAKREPVTGADHAQDSSKDGDSSGAESEEVRVAVAALLALPTPPMRPRPENHYHHAGIVGAVPPSTPSPSLRSTPGASPCLGGGMPAPNGATGTSPGPMVYSRSPLLVNGVTRVSFSAGSDHNETRSSLAAASTLWALTQAQTQQQPMSRNNKGDHYPTTSATTNTPRAHGSSSSSSTPTNSMVVPSSTASSVHGSPAPSSSSAAASVVPGGNALHSDSETFSPAVSPVLASFKAGGPTSTQPTQHYHHEQQHGGLWRPWDEAEGKKASITAGPAAAHNDDSRSFHQVCSLLTRGLY